MRICADGQHLYCDGEWHAYIEGLRFGKGGDVPLSVIAQSIATAYNERELLMEELGLARMVLDEMASQMLRMVERHPELDWEPLKAKRKKDA